MAGSNGKNGHAGNGKGRNGNGKKAKKSKPGSKPARKLTFKEALFADEYVRNKGNGKQAVLAAGYDTKNPDVIAAQNLAKLRVQERIKSRIDQAGISAQEVLGGLAEISRFDITDLLDPNGLFGLQIDQATNAWRLLGQAGAVQMSEERRKIWVASVYRSSPCLPVRSPRRRI